MIRRIFTLAVAVSLMLLPMPSVTAQSNECGPGPSVPFANETLTVSTTALPLTATVYAPSSPPKADQAIIVVNSESIRIWFDGSTPTGSVGIILAAGQSVRVCALSLPKVKMIRDGASDSEVAVEYSGPAN